MDSPRSYVSHDVDSLETRALATLLDAFHPGFSLQQIASAYCSAGKDISKASEILCQIQESDSSAAVHEQSEKSSYEDKIAEGSSCSSDDRGVKPKKIRASVGSISSILGKSYVRPTSFKKEMREPTKPLKVEVKGPMLDEPEVEPVEVGSVPSGQKICDMEDFLFAMLGHGFQLSREVIRQVLGDCGYDVKKGMEELFVISAKALGKGKLNDYGTVDKCTDDMLKSEPCIPEVLIQRGLTESSDHKEERSNLSREVLVSLFNAPDRSEEPKKRLEWGLNRTRVAGKKVVTKPLDDVDFSRLTKFELTHPDIEHVADDDNYRMLRGAAREHWEKMKECYKAAVDAFSNGDHLRANNLLEEGRGHNNSAREADDNSARLILESRNSEVQNDVPLDLHTYSAKDAVCMLKKHLHMLAKLPMFRYLKVTVNTDVEDITKGKRKRLVIKLLERESIKWTEEEGDPGMILIELKEIDPNKLSFASDLQ